MKIFLRKTYESLHELIRSNVLTATRNFHHRVEAHIHGTLWLDIKNIEKQLMLEIDVQEQKEGLLLGAFRKLREYCPLTENEKKVIAKFTDAYISFLLNPQTVHANEEKGRKNCRNDPRSKLSQLKSMQKDWGAM